MIVLLIGAVALAAFVALRLSGHDGHRYTASAVALLPYVTVGGLVMSAIGLGVRDWWIGGVTLALALVLVGCVAPRIVPGRSRATGPSLTVMASNLLLGRADVKTVVELVRLHRVDVLTLLELTPECADEFARAGLFDLLPHRVLEPIAGGKGSGIASRYPLTELDLVAPTTLAQPSARLDVNGIAVEIVAVHPVPPTYLPLVWQAELAGLPPTTDDAIRVLAGDFNGTVDHGTFRKLLRRGYVDAASRRGAGLAPTWRWHGFPLVTLDHVLIDARAKVVDCRVFDVPGSDHVAVCAALVLRPTGGGS